VFQLPDNIQEAFNQAFGKAASAETLTHLKRELIHAIWALLLNEKFMHAYEHGIIVECADGVLRRLYPRFFYLFSGLPREVSVNNSFI